MKVKFKKTNENARLPERAYSEDARKTFAYDCYAVSREPYKVDGKVIPDHYVYGLGFALQLDTEHADWSSFGFTLRPRSSINKHNAVIRNAPCTIDENYTGEIKVVMWCPIHELPLYEVGEAICQLHSDTAYDLEFVETHELSATKRGDGGFGSSNKKQ